MPVTFTSVDLKKHPNPQSDFYRIMGEILEEQKVEFKRIANPEFVEYANQILNKNRQDEFQILYFLYVAFANDKINATEFKTAINFFKQFKFLEHAEKILSGRWLELDFDDVECIRNFYTACEFGLINGDQLATATYLHNARQAYSEEGRVAQIKEFRFDDSSGPYNTKEIAYVKEDQIQEFYKQLQLLPVGEQKYFSINFTSKQVAYFLCVGLNNLPENNFRVTYDLIFANYILSRPINSILQLYLVGLIKALYSEDKSKQEYANLALTAFILSQEKEAQACLLLSSTLGLSITFLYALLHLSEQLPAIEISKELDLNNPNAPLLCAIVLPMSAFNALQVAIHGADATLPLYVPGKASVSLLRRADEMYQKRVIEITHPDFLSERPHGYEANKYMTTFHDIFHVWRNGSNPFKPLFRFLRNLLETEKGFYMSKAIWNLTDMDVGTWKARIENNDDLSGYNKTAYFIWEIILKAGDDFEANLEKDHNLLIIADMACHFQTWLPLFKLHVVMKHVARFCPTKFEFLKLYAFFAKIVNPQNQSATYYVVRYRLRNLEDGMLLANKLDNTDILLWNRNGGLYINPLYTESTTKVELEKLSTAEIGNCIRLALQVYESNEVRVAVKVADKSARKHLQLFAPLYPKHKEIRKVSNNLYSFSRSWISSVAKNNPCSARNFLTPLIKDNAAAIMPLYQKLKL
jgi:hypothetical protein